MAGSKGLRSVLHRSVGNVIDFHVGRDMLFIENYEGKATRLFEMSRGPRVDPRPFMTHKKKMSLEQMSDLQGLYSITIGSAVLIQILAVKRNNIYTFFREEPS